MSTYYFPTLYTTLLYNLIKELTVLIEQTFKREGSLLIGFNEKRIFHF